MKQFNIPGKLQPFDRLHVLDAPLLRCKDLTMPLMPMGMR